MNSSSFVKFYLTIACSEDIWGRYCIQKVTVNNTDGKT